MTGPSARRTGGERDDHGGGLGDEHHAQDQRDRRRLGGGEHGEEGDLAAEEEHGRGDGERTADYPQRGGEPDRARERPDAIDPQLGAGGERDERHRDAVHDLQVVEHGRVEEADHGRADHHARRDVAGELRQARGREDRPTGRR